MNDSAWKIRVDRRLHPRRACWRIWPPQEKLKLGIDLSGGTILVYEVVNENLPLRTSTWTS